MIFSIHMVELDQLDLDLNMQCLIQQKKTYLKMWPDKWVKLNLNYCKGFLTWFLNLRVGS